MKSTILPKSEICYLLVHPCDKVRGPCKNGGACEKDGDGLKCNCSVFFTGDTCEKRGKQVEVFFFSCKLCTFSKSSPKLDF